MIIYLLLFILRKFLSFKGYRARLTMPKLLIAATGDEFFLCQDTHYWWSNMTKPMYLQ